MSLHVSSNFRRRTLSVVSAVFVTVLFLQFQNCAPAASDSTTTSTDGGARVVDDLNKVEIQFGNNEIEIQDSADEVTVSGLCNRNRNGAKLRWAVWDGADSVKPLISGDSSCKSGQFSFQMAGLNDFVCGISSLLVVESDWGAVTQVKFKRRCQALASQTIATPPDEPIGTVCEMEYSFDADSEAPCVKVCYREDKVVSNDVLESNLCASLAASLTGH
jgi:hypothetical protein